MMPTPTTTRVARPRASAFSLMEVLVALGLFALGFAAVAAIFPAGALLQRETADDIQGGHTERNARAIVRGTPMDSDAQNELDDWYYQGGAEPDNNSLMELEYAEFLDGADALWTLRTRSYPSTEVLLEDRRFFWVPLIRDKNGEQGDSEWEMIVFVLRRDAKRLYEDQTTPDEDDANPGLQQLDVNNAEGRTFEVALTADETDVEFEPNDRIVDEFGAIYRVEAVNGNELEVDGYIENAPEHIWYAPRPTATEDGTPLSDERRGRLASPALRVFQVDLN